MELEKFKIECEEINKMNSLKNDLETLQKEKNVLIESEDYLKIFRKFMSKLRTEFIEIFTSIGGEPKHKTNGEVEFDFTDKYFFTFNEKDDLKFYIGTNYNRIGETEIDFILDSDLINKDYKNYDLSCNKINKADSVDSLEQRLKLLEKNIFSLKKFFNTEISSDDIYISKCPNSTLTKKNFKNIKEIIDVI